MIEFNPGRTFALYGSPLKSIKASELREMDDARAETSDSGCEGMYCEVAKWNETAKRWERFAFCKFFGDEEHTEVERADTYTSYINAGWTQMGFVHDMPDYQGGNPMAELLTAAEKVVACGALPRERHLCEAIKELVGAIKKARGETDEA